MTRKRKKPTAQPRAIQARPTISFRTDRAILVRLDELADGFGVTRNEVMERTLKHYLVERGDDIEAIMGSTTGGDDAQLDIFG